MNCERIPSHLVNEYIHHYTYIMFERIVLSKVTFMEILITTIINVGFIILVGFFSSKLYKKGTLHYGKKASLIKIIRGKE